MSVAADVLSRFLGSSAGLKIAGDIAAEDLAARRRVAADRASALAELEKNAPGWAKREAAAVAAVAKARQALVDAEQALAAVVTEIRAARRPLELRAETAAATLYATADSERLHAARARLADLDRAVCSAATVRVESSVRRLDGRPGPAWCDVDAKCECLERIRAIARALPDVALEALDTPTLERRIADLEAAAGLAVETWRRAMPPEGV